MKIEVWPRADGMTEIEGAGFMTRYSSQAEVEAFLDGLANGLRVAGNAISAIKIEDRRAKPEKGQD